MRRARETPRSLTLSRFAAEVAALAARAGREDDGVVARGVAERLPALLADPALLTPEQRRPSDDGYAQHVLYVHPDGRFSVVALVWGPGQATPPHDHVAWCVVGVYEGEEAETSFRVVETDGRRRLVPVAVRRCRRGDVTWLLPGADGDIHRVENPTDGTAISIHVYGADIARLGTSIRERYATAADHLTAAARRAGRP